MIPLLWYFRYKEQIWWLVLFFFFFFALIHVLGLQSSVLVWHIWSKKKTQEICYHVVPLVLRFSAWLPFSLHFQSLLKFVLYMFIGFSCTYQEKYVKLDLLHLTRSGTLLIKTKNTVVQPATHPFELVLPIPYLIILMH